MRLRADSTMASSLLLVTNQLLLLPSNPATNLVSSFPFSVISATSPRGRRNRYYDLYSMPDYYRKSGYNPAKANESAHDNDDDAMFRWIRRHWPKWLQYWLRDSGTLRWMVDVAGTALLIPPVLQQYPTAWNDYASLSWPVRTAPGRGRTVAPLIAIMTLPLATEKTPNQPSQGQALDTSNGVVFETVRYGRHRRQVVHLFMRAARTTAADSTRRLPTAPSTTTTRVLVFVHGGAWGSGFPELYRLVATPFLGMGGTNPPTHDQVAVVGYRTYPTTNVTEQIDDVRDALDRIVELAASPTTTVEVTLVGHSSGSHLCVLGLLTHRVAMSQVARFIGLAGVYDIPSHYRFEKNRGVERISPMAMACGRCSLTLWKQSSPTYLLQNDQVHLRQPDGETNLAMVLPPMLFCHGGADSTVPWSSSAALVQALAEWFLRNHHHDGHDSRPGQAPPAPFPVTFRLLPTVGHSEMMLHLMFGGETRDVVMEWLQLHHHENKKTT